MLNAAFLKNHIRAYPCNPQCPLPLDVETARWSPAGPKAQRLQKAPANDLKFQEFEHAAKNLLLPVTETEGECDEASCRTGIVAVDHVGAEHAASAGCMASPAHHVRRALWSGGYTDLVGRLTARYVEKALGKPVIVD